MAQTLTFDLPPESSNIVLHRLYHDIPSCSPTQVLVKMLAAPINPLDMLVLKGEYPVKPQNFVHGLPIPGFDAVCQVLECGSETVGLNAGDQVIVTRHGLGTWRTHAAFEFTDVAKIPEDMKPVTASILRMGIMTAFLLLETTMSDKTMEGDWIIVNAATGVIAHFLMQFALRVGLKVMAVIRDRDQEYQNAQTKSILMRCGATTVVTETELSSLEVPKENNIVLGYDSVFGATGQKLISKLSTGATYVAYGFQGGMGPAEVISINQESIFLKNITFKGFRFSTAYSTLTKARESRLFELWGSMIHRGLLIMPILDIVKWDLGDKDLSEVIDAMKNGMDSSRSRGHNKSIIMFPLNGTMRSSSD